MGQFLKEILTYLTIIFLFLFVAKKSVPFYWGNPDLGGKIDYLLHHQENYNSYFIGSSGIYRQVNPLIFDSIAETQSFNLGFDAMFYLETHFILENVLTRIDNTHFSDKTLNVFQSELSVHNMNKKILHSVRNKYWVDFKRCRMAFSHFWKSKNFTQIIFYLRAYIENILCIGELKGIAFYHMSKNKEVKEIIIEQNGFYPMDQEMRIENNLGLKESHQRHKLSNAYQKGVNMNKDEIDKYSFGLQNSNAECMDDLELNWKLYQIPWSIPLGPRYEFDKGHLNEIGSNIYSQKLGEAYLRISN